MFDPIHNTVEGWMNWQVIGANGRIEQEGEQHNLITNLGLDTIGAAGFLGAVRFAVIGTGSNPPAFTDTAMGFEVNRTDQSGGVATTTTRTGPGQYRFVQTREFIETEANGNFTEWGMASSVNSGLSVRELFRDGQGNPVVVSKDNTQRLRLIYTLNVTVGPAVRTPASVTITGLGTLTGSYLLHLTVEGFALGDLETVQNAMRGYGLNDGDFKMSAFTETYIRDLTYDSYISTEYKDKIVPTPAPAYVPGSFTRGGGSYTFSPSQGNGLITGFGLTVMNASQYRTGYTFALNPGQEINKTNLDRLTIVGPSVSWGRA